MQISSYHESRKALPEVPKRLGDEKIPMSNDDQGDDAGHVSLQNFHISAELVLVHTSEALIDLQTHLYRAGDGIPCCISLTERPPGLTLRCIHY